MATDVLEYAEKKRQVWVFGKHHRSVATTRQARLGPSLR